MYHDDDNYRLVGICFILMIAMICIAGILTIAGLQ